MDNRKRKKVISYIIITVLACFFVLASVVRCAMLIRENYTVQIKQTLCDVSNQCAESLEEQIDTRYSLLKSIAMRFETDGDDRASIIDKYYFVVESFHLRRLGYLDKEGFAYATDVEGIDLSYREFFKRSIDGDLYISDVLHDALRSDGELVTVMSMPIRNDDGEIDSVAAITYETKTLSDELAVKCFDGHGDNFVINQHFNVVSSSNEDILPVGINLTETNYQISSDEEINESDIVISFLNKEIIEGRLLINNENYYFRMLPVELMDSSVTWFVLSLVPENYLNSRFDDIERNLFRMLVCIIVIFVFFGVGARFLFRAQRKITYSLAYISPMTGGPNLAKFFEVVKRNITVGHYVAFMNLEEFTHTSIATGIEKSNDLIKKIWDVIKGELDQGEYACHDKADSFVLYLNAENDDELKERLTRIRDEIHQQGHNMDVPWVFAKFGVYKIKEEDSVETAYSKAEYAVFNIWGIKECVYFYNIDDLEKQTLNKAIEENFDNTLAEKRFEVWFQPKYNVEGNLLTGAEALVRWRKKDGSLLSPGLFIPLLEKNGDIAKLDEYVFERVCEKQREWKDKGIETVPVSINVSRATLYRDKIVDNYLEIIDKYNLSTSDIQLEVTETIVGGSEIILELLSKFRSAGIKILMDDFGTGYSSLSTLNMKCFDTLKIDKSLVDEISDDYGRIIVYQTIQLGNELGLHITVEGVEEKSQLDLLNKTKCDDIQGYFFSKPLPENEYEEKLVNEVKKTC